MTIYESEVAMAKRGDESRQELADWRGEVGTWRMVPLEIFAMLARIEAEVRSHQIGLEGHSETVQGLEHEEQRLERAERAQASTPERRVGQRLEEERESLLDRRALQRGIHQSLGRRHQKLVAKLRVLERMDVTPPASMTPSPVDLCAGDLMTPDLITVREAAPLLDGVGILMDYEISGAVVVDEDGQPTGVLSTTDVALAACESDPEAEGKLEADFFLRSETSSRPGEALPELPESLAEMTVGDVMNPEIYAVSDATSVVEVARRMLDEHIHRLLVIRGDQLVGIISTSDMLGLLVD